MIENILSIARDVQIRISVIVVIADRNAHAVIPVSSIRQASLLGDIDKASVFVLPVQPVPVPRVFAVEIFW